MCPVRQSKSIAQADARKQALCSQRTSYAHRPRRRLSVRSGLAVLGYEADCQKLTSEGGSPVLPTNHSLEQQRQHGKIPLDVRCLMKKIRPSSHPLSPYFQHFTPSWCSPHMYPIAPPLINSHYYSRFPTRVQFTSVIQDQVPSSNTLRGLSRQHSRLSWLVLGSYTLQYTLHRDDRADTKNTLNQVTQVSRLDTALPSASHSE